MIDERLDRDLTRLGDKALPPVVPKGEALESLGVGVMQEGTGSTPAHECLVSRSAALRSEAEVIRRICAGENNLFVELIKPYQKMVYGMAVSIVKNEHDAEEVAQESLFKAFKNLSQFRGEAKFSTWIVQIAMNEARQRLRRQKRVPEQSLECGLEKEEGAHVPIDFADWREIPSEALHRKELRKVLNNAISSLKPIYRDVLVLRDIQHFSVAETAESLCISEASVKTRLSRARFQVRDALAPGFDGHWNTGSNEYKRVRPF
jgi:RNA polymerase sigma-70 factor (ECF subfamily)